MRPSRRLTSALRTFGAVFRNPELRRVELAYAGFGMAEMGTWVAILVFAYGRGGATEAGVVAVIQLVPSAIVAPFASILGDRIRRERALLVGYVLQTVTVGATGAALLGGAPAPLAYALAAAAASTLTLTRPVQGALFPSLARTPQELTAANVAAGSIASATVLAGPAAAGALMGLWNPGMVFAVNAGLLLLSTLSVARLRASTPPVGGDTGASEILAASVRGFRDLRRDRSSRLVVGLLAGKSVVEGALDVLIVVTAIGVLGLGEAGAGYLSAAMGAGGLVGAAAALALVGRRRLSPALGGGVLIYGAPVAGIAAAATPPGAAGLLVVSGAGYSLADVAGRTLLQRLAPNEIRSRIFGVLEGLNMAALAVGAIIAPMLVAMAGPRGALVAVGVLLPVVTLLSWRTLAIADAAAPVALEAIELLASTPLFAPLPAPALEDMAARLVPVKAAEGEVLIREGDHGDRFYVIAAGSVRVTRAGGHVADLGPGDHVGEIALLRDVPRTATVTATSPSRLLALERHDFLEAVTGHAAIHAHAEGVVRQRLGEEEAVPGPGGPGDP
jgi:MFS family permease